MLELSMEIAELHDMLLAAPVEDRKSIIESFRPTPALFKRIIIPTGKLIWPTRGDGYISCYYCGRRLTDPNSRIRGCGPICFSKRGAIPHRSNVLENIYKNYLKACANNDETPLTFKEWAGA